MALFNDITLGHYYPGDSFIHRLDPRTKLIAIMVLMTSLLVSYRPILLFGFILLTIFIVILSRFPVSLVFRNLRPFIWLFAITLTVHIFWTPGRILWHIPLIGIDVTSEGLRMGLVYSIRLALLIVYAAILTLSTSPIELTDSLERLLSPLKRLRVPTHEIIMMLTLSLRFIPTLLEEAQRIKNAQLSRGATFEGNVIRRIRSIIPLILPLFVSAFRRADELALAMDSRCYMGGEGRTSYKVLQFKAADYLVLTIVTAALVASIVI